MKKIIIILTLSLLTSSNLFADFKKIKKKAVVNNPEIIFPIKKNEKK